LAVRVTIAVPTLVAGEPLAQCLAALAAQTEKDFRVVVVDNSGVGRVDKTNLPDFVTVLVSAANRGYGGAVNWAAREFPDSEFIAALNDDAVPSPGWLAALLRAAAAYPQAGMFAPRVRLSEKELDSAGMLLYGDGSSKQRGHKRPPAEFDAPGEALLPSGSSALYRRKMFDGLGGFDEDFFLYCEDTDLGLRAQWAGWTCRYVPEAIVDHRYSASAGRVSPLKAYYVERNRLRVALKNFPLGMLAAGPGLALRRYLWHAVTLLSGGGPAGKFQRGGGSPLLLMWFPVRAHFSAFWSLPSLWRARRRTMKSARIKPEEFVALTRRHALSAQEVATL